MGYNYFHTRTNVRRDRRRHFKQFFDTAAKKAKRSAVRKEKLRQAIQSGVPCGQLKPTVSCCSKKYNIHSRKGKGFSLEELKNAKISLNLAKSFKISIDLRRKSCHQSNIASLKDFMSKVVVHPSQLKNPVLQGRKDIIEQSKREENSQKPVQMNLYKLYPAFQVRKPESGVSFVKMTDEIKTFPISETLKAQFKKKHHSNRNKFDKAAAEEAKKKAAAQSKKGGKKNKN